MLPSIWTRCAEGFRLGRLNRRAWRAVEDQSLNSTRKLVDSDAEQALLEALIDGVKPIWPPGERLRALHSLLATPFRYPPLRYGSRFGTRAERGIFYGAEIRRTVLAEKAYYQCLFLAGTKAAFASPITQSLTLLQFGIATRRGADLTRPPFAERSAQRAILKRGSTSDYSSQRFSQRSPCEQSAGFAPARAIGSSSSPV
jgi:hypothetical protein